MAGEEQKLALEYPCPWSYKVIGSDPVVLRQAIVSVVRERPCQISVSNRSRTGKYQSMQLELEVRDEAERTTIYQALKEHADIILVM